MRTLPKYKPYGRSLLRRCFPGALLALLPLASGCIAESGDCPDDISEQDITVSLVIEGGLPSQTRADEFTEEQGTLAESYINIDDLYVLAFEIGEGKDVADGDSELKDIIWSPVAAQRLPESVISSNGTQVLLRTFLSSQDYDTSTPFSIVTIANTENWLADSDTGFSLTTKKEADADGTKTKQATKLSELQKVLSYTKAIGESASGVANTSWVPDNAASSGIPLFGIKRTTLAGYNNKFHSSANPYPLGTIWMLRTLAKVEIYVADGVNKAIESANVIVGGWNTDLHLIPFQNANPADLNRMEGYSTSDSSNYGSTGQVTLAPDFTNTNFTPSSSTSPLAMTQTTRVIDGVEKQVFVAYLPEYTLTGTFTGGEVARNDIIRVKFTDNGQEYPLAIAPYTDGNPGNQDVAHWQYLLRNHIYRFAITGVLDDKVQLIVKLMPWTAMDVNPVFPGEGYPEIPEPTN